MPKPRILICSTCYDLKDLRSVIRESLAASGYEPILSEYNDILFNSTDHTHTACLKNVETCDLVVLIIGERYGGEVASHLRELDIKAIVKSFKGIENKEFEKKTNREED